jgi:hypothetical protein
MSKYQIIKLRSGEDIITKIIGKSKDKYTLDRPMQLKIQSYLDPISEQRKDVMMMRDWLQNTNEINVDIPVDWVATILTPDEETVVSYDEAKNQEDIMATQDEIDEQNEEDFLESQKIVVTVAIPPMVFFQMLAQGLIGKDGFMSDFKGMGDYTDWSPNIDDYLDDDEE